MLSSKCQKYINQYQEKNYAPKKRKIEKSDLRKHRNGSPRWKTTETSCSNCIQQSREVKEAIIEYGRHVILTEEVIYTGEDEKDGDNRDRERRSRRNEEIVKILMDMPDIPKKQTKRKRKTINHQRDG